MSRIAAIGGGHGLSRTLTALRDMDDVEVTAIVTVADDGGSSGRLRRDFGVIPPGDMRKALASLTVDRRWADWLEYRFGRGDLAGHALGNLMMVSLADVLEGDLLGALDAIGRMVGARGRVVPATLESVHLVADGERGTTFGQVAIARSSGHARVRLEPDAPMATPAAVAAIADADLVILGPGSLFTSILPNVIVPGIAAALAETPARVVLVGNLREQPGETEGLDLAAHLDVLAAHLPERPVDVLIAHDGPTPRGPGSTLEPVAGHPHVRTVEVRNLLDGRDGHDPARLADAISSVLAS